MGNPTQILPANVQIVNVNPLRVTTPQQQNKNMPPRFMIPQMVGSRPGQQGQITLQALQGLQGGQGHLLLKTENGQYQLLRVGPATTQSSALVSNSATNNTTALQPASFRLQTVPVCTVSANAVTTTSNAVVVNNSNQNAGQQLNRVTDNTKEKCRKFLANLLELSSREPKAVEKNVRSLIQELVDAKVEPEEFCDRLEKLLNASPQPCLIGFLKKSLPLLRVALSTKEMTIDGIVPPSISSLTTNSSTTVVLATQAVVQNQLQNNQIRPTVQLGSMQQMRVVPTMNSTMRPLGHTQHRILTPVRVQASSVIAGTGANISTMGPGTVTKVLSASGSHVLPVVGTTVRIQTPIMSASTTSTTSISVASASVQTPSASTEIITTASTNTIASSTIVSSVPISSSPMRLPAPVRHTLIKTLPIRTSNNTITLQTNTTAATPIVRTSLPAIKPVVTVPVLKNSVVSKPSTVQTKSITCSTVQPKSTAREKEKKPFSSSSLALSSSSASFVPDDDVNDVAAMAGVNLFEESQRILGSTEFVGTQIRSCKDDTFVPMQNLVKRAHKFTSQFNYQQETISSDVLALVSHSIQERLKNNVEKLAVFTEHRTDFNKVDSRYEVIQDVRGQLKCIEEIDKIDRRKRNESERELLLRAAKSRSKSEDPEQVKLKAKAKEMQRAEMEELRQREANVTALLAIGPRKKLKTDPDANNVKPSNDSSDLTNSNNTPSGRMPMLNRPRLKRVTMKDMLFLMEQERETCRSNVLYRSYLK